jgi:ferric-dicitrate binding protein FerR (iron transport regulator)
MTNYQSYRKIIRLITKEISEKLTLEEERELSLWIEELPENKALYTQIKSSQNFRLRNEEYQQINILTGWERLHGKIERANKIVKFRRIFLYAAVILVPLVIVGVLSLYVTRQKLEGNHLVYAAKILPGKPRATLVLDNGKSVSLDSLNQLSIKERDGTLIEKGAQSLNYIKNTGNAIVANVFNTIKIPRGGEYSLVLADGTRVYLNSESQLKYPVQFPGNIREVELTGEAYFEVKRIIQKPFIVKTARMNIEVLGTSFNINAYENTDKVLTTLVEGSVKINVSGSQETKLLKPDEQALFDIKSGRTEIRNVDVNLYTAWKDGRLNFFDTRLEDIMVTLARWYSADIIYENASVKDLRFSGSLDRYGDINQVLDIIKSTGKVKIEIKGSIILFSK